MPAEIPEDILNNIASIDVFEYQEGTINNDFIVFSIYVGEKSTLNELITSNKKILIRIKDNKIIVMNELGDNDIVVHNKDELQKIIKIISIEHQFYKKS